MKSILLQDWKFIREDVPEAFGRIYDDSAWADVAVPHDWSVGFPFSKEHSSGTGYLPGGIGWYRAGFTVDSDVETAFITFDGVYKNAQVWVNGYYLGKRPNGYISFTHDISPFVRREGRNFVAVKVNHTDIADSRWFTGSGIYRKVKLLTHSGPYIPSDSVVFTYDGEQIYVKAHLEGKLSSPINISFGEHEWTVNAIREIDFAAYIENPRLWSVDEPNLYMLSIKSGGKLLCEPIRVGLRTFRFDADTGFYLNGISMKIKGVCVHHDAGCLGAAVWSDVWRRRLEKLKDAGCNAIRTAHNPHMPELYDLCDGMGFLMMGEAFDEWEGCKNKWTLGHNVYPPVHQGYYEDFHEWHERDLSDMVIRDRNHPSVIMWSIGNEIDYPNDPYVHPLFEEMTGNNDLDKPAQEMVYSDDKPNAERLSVIAKKLTAIVKKHDDTRPVLAAAAFPELSSQIGFFDSFDIVGYNYREHHYEQDHARFPDLPIIGSENTHDEELWLAVKNNDFISAQFLWAGVDFLGEARGWPIRGSQAGILDTAGNEKPRFYERKSMWTGEAIKNQEADYGKATQIALSIWKTPSIQGAYRLFQVEAAIQDKDGNLCADNSAVLHYNVKNGKLLGIENGDLSDLLEYSAPYRRVYRGRAIAYILVKVGEHSVLTVSGEGFADKGLRLE